MREGPYALYASEQNYLTLSYSYENPLAKGYNIGLIILFILVVCCVPGCGGLIYNKMKGRSRNYEYKDKGPPSNPPIMCK